MTLEELLAKIAKDGYASLTGEEIVQLKALLDELSDELLDEDATDEVLAQLEELSEHLTGVNAEEARRAAEAAEREAKKEELRAKIKGEAPADDADADAAAEADEAEATDEAPAADGEDADAEQADEAKEPVGAAASTTKEVGNLQMRVAARRPEAAPQGRPRQAPIRVSANVPGMQAGAELRNDMDWFRALSEAADLQAQAVDTSRPFKMAVATGRVEIPRELCLTLDDPEENQRRLEPRRKALRASGGVPTPVPYRYDLPIVGDATRVVRNAMTTVGAERGGIKTLVPPTISSVDGTTGTSPIGEWTMANDVALNSPATKPYMTINQAQVDNGPTMVKAITSRFKIGNFRDRWAPEQVAAIRDLAAVWGARFADAKLLASMTALSKVVTHGQNFGSSRDPFTALRQLISGMHYRHRAEGLPVTVIGFEWVKDAIITDLIRQGVGLGGGTQAEQLTVAEATLDNWFRANGARVVWSQDYEFGRAVGQSGGPMAGTQGVGPVIGYPSVARFYVAFSGSWLYVDGGRWDFGVIRDNSMLDTNDMMLFSEYAENVHYHGVPGEAYTFDIDMVADGSAGGSKLTTDIAYLSVANS